MRVKLKDIHETIGMIKNSSLYKISKKQNNIFFEIMEELENSIKSQEHKPSNETIILNIDFQDDIELPPLIDLPDI